MTTKAKAIKAVSDIDKVDDLSTAEKLVKAYADLQKEKSIIDQSMKEAKARLGKFAKKNKKQFDDSGNLHFPDGYLHFGEKTTVVTAEDFSLKKFVAKAPEFLNNSFKTGMLKQAFTDADARKRFEGLGVDLQQKEEFSIVIK